LPLDFVTLLAQRRTQIACILAKLPEKARRIAVRTAAGSVRGGVELLQLLDQLGRAIASLGAQLSYPLRGHRGVP
jgi:hypothetical protein